MTQCRDRPATLMFRLGTVWRPSGGAELPAAIAANRSENRIELNAPPEDSVKSGTGLTSDSTKTPDALSRLHSRAPQPGLGGPRPEEGAEKARLTETRKRDQFDRGAFPSKKKARMDMVSQLATLRSLIEQMGVSEMWVSQIFSLGRIARPCMPVGYELIDYPEAVRRLAEKMAKSKLAEAKRHQYRQIQW